MANWPVKCRQCEEHTKTIASQMLEIATLRAENETLKRDVTIATLVMGNLINKVPITDDDMQWAREKIAELDKEWNNDRT